MRLSQQKHQTEKLLKNIAKAPKSKLRGAICDFLDSHAAKVDAVTEAARKKRKKLSKTDVQLIAQDLDVWKPCAERVWLHPEPRGDALGGFRWILSFGVRNSARQILVRNVLAARGGISPSQTLFHGGRDEAIRRVKENYEAGYQHIFEIDVQRCFSSFDKERIGRFLALPERVVTNVLSGTNLSINLSHPYRDKALAYDPVTDPKPIQLLSQMDSDWEPARQGLSEGSMASPLAAELLLAWIVNNVTDGAWRIVIFADNFLCQCQDEDAVHALNDELRELLHQHPAGPLKAKSDPLSVPPSSPFFFLGYALVPSADGVLTPCPDDKAYRKLRNLRRELYGQLNSPTMPQKRKSKMLREVLKKQRQIVNGFKEWEGAEAYLAEKEAKLKREAKKNKVFKSGFKLPVYS